MLLPLRHENMTARRWPVISIALVALNVLVFLGTHWKMDQEGPHLAEVKAHILLLAAMHPELNMPPDVQQFVGNFRDKHASLWKQIQAPNRNVEDAWDARVRLMEEPEHLQAEMDSLAQQFAEIEAVSIRERYAFVPAHPRAMSYLTANFLHGGWLHLIGNMWFLWLAGIVLEDTWGRLIYSGFYLLAGVFALQIHAWSNAGSIAPALGASGAVAGLMGAFLVRFPKTKIEMMWLFWFRSYRFRAPAYSLLPLWLLMEVFYGTLFGQATGVAHWAHVGGFVFGALVALGLRYSGLEQKATQAIDAKVGWTSEPAIIGATDLLEKGQFDEAITLLKSHLSTKPDTTDAYALLQQAYWRKNDIPAYQETLIKVCQLHLKAQEPEAAWHAYEEFLNSGGEKMPAATWLELCRLVENQQNFDRAVGEYEKLAAAYPKERQSILAQVAAGRLCLKRLNRPSDAMRFYQSAGASPVPHLDWEANIQAGIREAQAALSTTYAPAGKD